MNFPYTVIIEIVCLFFAITYLKKEKGYWNGIMWFMLFTVITEMAGYCMRVILHYNNHWLYNFYLLAEASFMSWLLYKISIFNSKPLVITGLAVFVICYLYESIHSDFTEYSSVSNSILCIYLTIVCCLYYYFLLKRDEYINVVKYAPFWIITGCFFFYFGRIGCNFFFEYLVAICNKYGVPVRYIIFIILNFILYGCWSYAFICRYRHTISS